MSSGAITNLEGPGRRDVKLDVRISDGRVEDVLALVIDAPAPVMTGDVTLQASLALPPGPTRVRDRLALDGAFGLAATEFTDGGGTGEAHGTQPPKSGQGPGPAYEPRDDRSERANSP